MSHLPLMYLLPFVNCRMPGIFGCIGKDCGARLSAPSAKKRLGMPPGAPQLFLQYSVQYRPSDYLDKGVHLKAPVQAFSEDGHHPTFKACPLPWPVHVDQAKDGGT